MKNDKQNYLVVDGLVVAGPDSFILPEDESECMPLATEEQKDFVLTFDGFHKFYFKEITISFTSKEKR